MVRRFSIFINLYKLKIRARKEPKENHIWFLFYTLFFVLIYSIKIIPNQRCVEYFFNRGRFFLRDLGGGRDIFIRGRIPTEECQKNYVTYCFELHHGQWGIFREHMLPSPGFYLSGTYAPALDTPLILTAIKIW